MKKEITRSHAIRRLSQPAIISRKSSINLLFINIFSSLTAVALVYSIQYATQAIEKNDLVLFNQWSIIGGCVAIIALMTNIYRKPHMLKYYSDMRSSIESLCIPKIINGDNNAYERIGTGKFISIYSSGSKSRSTIVADILGKMMGSAIFFTAFLVTVYQKDVQFFYISLGIVLISCLWFYLVGFKQFKRRKLSKETTINVSRNWTRWFMSKFEIMQQDKIHDELKNNKKLHNEWFGYKKTEKFHQGIAFDGIIFFSTVMYIGLLYYTGKGVFRGTMSYSDLVVIVGLGSMFVTDLEYIMRTIRMGIIDKWIDVEKLWDVLDELSNDHHNINTGKWFTHNQGSVSLQDTSFSYDTEGKSRILSNLSLTLPGGSKTALVGPSGGGKSTIIKLIAGYLRPDNGSVLVDDQDLTEVSLKSYYQHIGYLTQEPSVFDGTVWENLTYAMEGAEAYESTSIQDNLKTNDQRLTTVKQAISDAQCDFVWDLPDGLETEIGERGVRLSGGQRQRLAIAKIFLKDPAIVLLDEPTSALDSESEEKVTIAMNRLFEGRTVIVIAHRLQTVKHADRILYIEDGMVVEEGTHKELMKEKGKYYRMVELQSGF